MNRMQPVRTAVAIAGLVAARAAHADGGSISTSGWLSMAGILGITVALFWLHKKTN